MVTPAWEHAGVTTHTYRTASIDDVAVLVQLVHDAYRSPAASGWTTEADILGGQRADATMLAEVLDDPDATLVVASVDDEVVACGMLRHRPDDEVASFGLFAVDPTRQGGGIGGRLLTHIEHLAAEAGASRLRLEVIHTRHELLAWYRRRCYEPTGDTAPFPHGDDRFGVPKRDDLHFVVLERPLSPPTPT